MVLVYPVSEFVAKIRRLMSGLNSGKPFVIQIKNERIFVPRDAVLTVEYEKGADGGEEIEFQIRWKRKAK